MIHPNELINRLGIEGLNRSADAYYAQISDLTTLQAKPFSNASEAPTLLFHLGLLLGGLKLAPGMKVMDFGCGVGWLGRALLQLECDVLFTDVSLTALKAAEEFARKHPPLGASAFPRRATYERFDGRRLPAESGSQERIVTFAAYHHVPNQADVLNEFYRVLGEGGIVGLYEPGVGHSAAGGSQLEMREFEALENDVDIFKTVNLAKEIGFLGASFHLAASPFVTATESEFFSLHAHGRLDASVIGRMAFHTRSSYVFFLHKGQPITDSRRPEGLMAAFELIATPEPAGDELTYTLRVRIRNEGAARWLEQTPTGVGAVKVGIRRRAGDGTSVEGDFVRAPLDRAVQPGESIDLEITLRFRQRGRWHLVIDLVSEGVTWFEIFGSKPLVYDLDV